MCNLYLNQYLALIERIYVQSKLEILWILMNKKHLTSFENILIKKKPDATSLGKDISQAKKHAFTTLEM